MFNIFNCILFLQIFTKNPEVTLTGFAVIISTATYFTLTRRNIKKDICNVVSKEIAIAVANKAEKDVVEELSEKQITISGKIETLETLYKVNKKNQDKKNDDIYAQLNYLGKEITSAVKTMTELNTETINGMIETKDEMHKIHIEFKNDAIQNQKELKEEHTTILDKIQEVLIKKGK